MKDHEIVNFGKSVLGLCFLFGNIFFSGYLITKSTWLVEWGIFFLFYGILANLLAAIGLLLYSFSESLKVNQYLKLTRLFMFNIPLGSLYVMLGLNLN